MRNRLFVFITLLLSIPAFMTLIRPGYFPMHDDMQAMRLLQMDKCVRDFQIPCRWVPDMGYGYGYPQFNYYSPLPYYVMEAFHLVGFGILDSVKIGFGITVLISALGMYLLTRRLWGEWGGLLSSFLYVYAPYRAVDMYVRGAVGEFWALSALPFIFWSILKIRKSEERNGILFFALSLSALFLSHNVTTLISLPFIALFILLLSIKDYLKFKESAKILEFFKSAVLGSIWGFGLASFFLLPAFLEKKYAHVESLVGGYFDYRIHFVSISQLLFSNFWGYGGSEMGQYDEIFLGVGIVHWLIALLSLVSLAYFRKNKKLIYSLFFIFLGFASLFMAHSKSSPIWSILQGLEIIQFPWRFLVLSTFAFSAAAGAIMAVTNNRKILFVTILILVSIFYSTFFRPKAWIDITDEEKFTGENWRLQQTISIFDYLPIYAEFPPANRAPEKPQIIEGNAEVVDVNKKSNIYGFNIKVTEQAIVEIPVFYFPGWIVLGNDAEEIDFSYDNKLGLMRIRLDEGSHQIVALFTNTPVRKVGNMLTMISILGVVGYLSLRAKRSNL